MGIRLINIKTIPASKNLGQMSFFEFQDDIDFLIKRIYYITNVQAGCVRGFHAHKELKQILFCPYGNIELTLEDQDGIQTIVLDDPSKAVVLYPCVWRKMKWLVSDSVLCVAASDCYSESDYIRNYDNFLKYLREHDED